MNSSSSSSTNIAVGKSASTTSATALAGGGTSTPAANVVATKPRKPWTAIRVLQRVWKAFKYLYSCSLLGITLGICLYNISCNRSTFFSAPMWIQFILIFVFLFLLGTCESMMIALSQLRRLPTNAYEKAYTGTYRNAKIAFAPDVLEKFLMGRQANVIVVTFMLSHLLSTSTSVNSVGTLGAWIISGFLQTGLFGAFVVLILGNLVPQVTGAKFPLQLLNNMWMTVVIYWCLFIRFIGLTHACWLCVKGIAFMIGLDWNAPPLPVAQMKTEKSSASAASSVSTSPQEAQQPQAHLHGAGVVTTGDDVVYAENYLVFMTKHALVASARTIAPQISPAICKLVKAKEVPHGSLHWADPEHVSEIFSEHRLTTPEFLRPVVSSTHIPAHIVAFQLVAEHQRLLRELEDAQVDMNSAQVKATTTPLYTNLKSIVDVAALDRMLVIPAA